MPLKISNNATGKLAAAIDSVVTTISIQAGEDINFPVADQPGDWFPVTVVDALANREIMKCTGRSGTNMTVVRAQESTSAFSFSAGARVDVRLTAAALGEFMQKTDSNAMSGRLTLSGGNDLGRVKFTGSQALLATGKPLGLEFTQADLFFGVKPVDVETAGKQARWVWNDQADGTGNDVMSLTDAGVLSMAGGFTVGGDVVATGSITAGSTVYAKGATGNAHFWFRGPANEDRGVIYTNTAAAGHLYIRNSAQQSWTLATDGQFYSPNNLYASGARYQTDGNIVGAIWANLGYNDAYTAIVQRIESRAAAYANNCVNATQMAGAVDAEHPTYPGPGMQEYGAYVITGFYRATAQVYRFRYRQPQRHIPTQGWAAAFPF